MNLESLLFNVFSKFGYFAKRYKVAKFFSENPGKSVAAMDKVLSNMNTATRDIIIELLKLGALRKVETRYYLAI